MIDENNIVLNPDGTPLFGGGHYERGDGYTHFNGDHCSPTHSSIDEVLVAYSDMTGGSDYILGKLDLKPLTRKQALTAIYEIGLECIGADELIDHNRSWDIKEVKEKSIRNNLRASQRKAWAKSCGVAEK